MEVRGISKSYGNVEALRGVDLDFPSGQADQPARPERLREDDAAEDHRRAGRGRCRHDLRQRPARQQARTGTRLRVPGFRAAALGDRAAQRRLRAGAARQGGRRAREGRPPLYRRGRAFRLRGQVSARAVRRHAPARRSCPRAFGRCRRAAARRAVLGGRRTEPAEVPGRPDPAADQPEQDLHLRHPLDRGGGLHLRPHRASVAAAGPRLADHRAGHRPLGRSRPHPSRQALSRYGRGDLAGAEAICRIEAADRVGHEDFRLSRADDGVAAGLVRRRGRSSAGST